MSLLYGDSEVRVKMAAQQGGWSLNATPHTLKIIASKGFELEVKPDDCPNFREEGSIIVASGRAIQLASFGIPVS